MGSAIQSGIYKIFLFFFSLSSGFCLLAQDYYVDRQGDTHYVSIADWHIDYFLCNDENEQYFISVSQVLSVYRSQAELVYKPYSIQVGDGEYADFFMPEIASFKALQTDFFRDEIYNMWSSGQYLLFEVYNAQNLLNVNLEELQQKEGWTQIVDFEELLKSGSNELSSQKLPDGLLIIYHDEVGFNLVVTGDMEEDYFKLLISKYSFNRELNDSLFSGDLKVKQKNFLDFFDERISPLTAVQWDDTDLAEYYINSLKEYGALVVLLNLDMRKIELYRDAGNASLADKLEEELKLENQSYAAVFRDAAIFDFCPVYITDAKNMSAILDGQRENIFLNTELSIDSNIAMNEDFCLFVRKGQVYETQAVNQATWKRQKITSNPVVQDAFVIYDASNVQIMPPFPFYERISTARYSQIEYYTGSDNLSDVSSAIKYLKKKYGLLDLDRNSIEVASSMNRNLHGFHKKVVHRYRKFQKQLTWHNSFIYNGEWIESPTIFKKSN